MFIYPCHLFLTSVLPAIYLSHVRFINPAIQDSDTSDTPAEHETEVATKNECDILPFLLEIITISPIRSDRPFFRQAKD